MNHSLNLETRENTDNLQTSDKVTVIGCGYVGKAIARYWYEKGYFVTGTTTREENVPKLDKITHQTVVMTTDDLAAMEKLIADQDTIVVSVAPISDRPVDAPTYGKTYLPTAKNLDETSPLDMENDYAKVLAEAERILLEAKDIDAKICILRLGGIYGPKRELNKRLGRFAGETLPGSGSNYTAWIHLEDIVSGVDFVRQKRCHGIYNLVNDVRLTSKELCDLICDRQNLARISWDENKSPFSALNARVDNSKIQKEGYQFIYPDTIV